MCSAWMLYDPVKSYEWSGNRSQTTARDFILNFESIYLNVCCQDSACSRDALTQPCHQCNLNYDYLLNIVIKAFLVTRYDSYVYETYAASDCWSCKMLTPLPDKNSSREGGCIWECSLPPDKNRSTIEASGKTNLQLVFVLKYQFLTRRT